MLPAPPCETGIANLFTLKACDIHMLEKLRRVLGNIEEQVAVATPNKNPSLGTKYFITFDWYGIAISLKHNLV